MQGDRYVARFQRTPRSVVEKAFFGFENAQVYAAQRGGWVTDGRGRILADFRPRWRQRLAQLVSRVRWWWAGVRYRRQRRRQCRQLLKMRRDTR
jgi:hypothetical protein